eukprot:9046562-Prorocentrum_lima.AAC.1
MDAWTDEEGALSGKRPESYDPQLQLQPEAKRTAAEKNKAKKKRYAANKAKGKAKATPGP